MGKKTAKIVGIVRCGGAWGNISKGVKAEVPADVAEDLVAAGYARYDKPAKKEKAVAEAPETRGE